MSLPWVHAGGGGWPLPVPFSAGRLAGSLRGTHGLQFGHLTQWGALP